MSKHVIVRSLVVAMLATALSCGSPESDTEATAVPTDRGNVLSITTSEYEFDVGGTPRAGTLTIDISNEGNEWHEVVMAKLQDGKTLEDARDALESAGEDEDPFAEFADEGAELIDDLGGSQFPGTKYAITGDGIVPGDYMLTCFVPDADGEPHWSLGMLSEFTIADGTSDAAPVADVTYTFDDEGLDGPTEVDAGKTVMRVVNDSKGTRELSLLRVKDGKTMKDVAESLEAADEGPPSPRTAPFDYFAYIFDAEQDRTLTVDLTPGLWAIQGSDPAVESSPPSDEDPNAIVFTVS